MSNASHPLGRAPGTTIVVMIVGLPLASAACGGEASPADSMMAVITSQDEIVSEDGMLVLTEGTLAIVSVSLVNEDGMVPLISSVTVDLAAPRQELPLQSEIPIGDYTGLKIDLAPPIEGAQTLDVRIRPSTDTEVRAISSLSINGTANFPEGPRTIDEDSTVELLLDLGGMFFYLRPVSDAVDGLYEAGENARDFLTMDLVGMFDLRVLP